MRNGLWSIVATALALIALTLAPGVAGAVPIGDSSAEKQEKLLRLLETFVPYAESYWCENASPGPLCNMGEQSNDSAGFFDAGGGIVGGLSQQRGEAAVVWIYATLLTGRPGQASFAGFDREDVIEYHLHQAIRHMAFTHKSLMVGGWGGPPRRSTGQWQASWGAVGLMYAAQQQWGILSRTTKDAVKTAIASQADELILTTPDGGPWMPQTRATGDTRAEENAWNAPAAAAGIGLMPTHGNASKWDYAAKALAINSSTLPADDTSRTRIDGVELGTWVNGTVNLEDDYTVTNHDFFHPVYTWGTFASLTDAMIIYAGSSLPVPDALMFRVEEVWDRVMGRLLTDDGDFLLPAGSDWTTHDYGQLPYLSLIATRLQRNDAAVAETHAIDQFVLRQDALLPSTRMAGDELSYEADIFRNVASSWWLHQQFGPAPDPDQAQYDAARGLLDGAWTFATQRTVIGRTADGSQASMSWNFSRENTWPTGLVVPTNVGHFDDPALVNPWKTSAVDGANGGVAGFSCDCATNQDHFSTASEIGTRMFSMSFFSDGTTILLDRGSGATASFGFEDVPGYTGSRTVRSDSGTGVEGNLSGNWANIGDRFGLVVKGGSGLWADQGDPTRQQPPLWLRGSVTDGSRNRGAVVFPNATGTTTDALETDVVQSTVSDSSWSALTAVAQNGTGKMAVARWGGSTSMTASGLRSSLGVPIPDRPSSTVTVTGSSGSTTFSGYDDPESHGYEANFFVATDGQTVDVARLTGGSRLLLHNTSGSSTRVTVKYDGGAGSVQTVTRTLTAGQAAQAMVDQGTLQVATIIASSTEPPGTYHAKLAFDFDTSGASNFWVADGFDLSRDPQCLTLDFGSGVTASLEAIEMTPRTRYGPKDYKIQTGTDRASTTCSATTDWTDRATVTSFGDGTVKRHSWTAVSARFVRIKITAAYGSGPPSYVQIRELIAS
jgi:hypothetical protein